MLTSLSKELLNKEISANTVRIILLNLHRYFLNLHGYGYWIPEAKVFSGLQEFNI